VSPYFIFDDNPASCLEHDGCSWIDGEYGVCVGDATPCDSLTNYEGCTGQLDCVWNAEYCDGEPNSCGDLTSWGEVKCLETVGCGWVPYDDSYCEGTPISCEFLGENFGHDKCIETPECYWNEGTKPYCDGVPTGSCAEIQTIGEENYYADKCTETPGCYWGTPCPP